MLLASSTSNGMVYFNFYAVKFFILFSIHQLFYGEQPKGLFGGLDMRWDELSFKPNSVFGAPSFYLTDLLYPLTMTWKQWFNIANLHASFWPSFTLPSQHFLSLSSLSNSSSSFPSNHQIFLFQSFLHLDFHLWSSMEVFFRHFVFRFHVFPRLFSSKICWFSKKSAITSVPTMKVLIAWLVRALCMESNEISIGLTSRLADLSSAL